MEGTCRVTVLLNGIVLLQFATSFFIAIYLYSSNKLHKTCNENIWLERCAKYHCLFHLSYFIFSNMFKH